MACRVVASLFPLHSSIFIFIGQAQLQVVPTPLPPQALDLAEYFGKVVRFLQDRIAIIGKRQGDAPATGPGAVHLHDRDHGLQPPFLPLDKIVRDVSIGFGQDSGPSSAMEEGIAGAVQEAFVPKGVGERVYYLETHGFQMEVLSRTWFRWKIEDGSVEPIQTCQPAAFFAECVVPSVNN